MPISKEGQTLYEKLALAQSKFKPAIKSAENPFFKSSYADLQQVWEACKEALQEQGLFVSQPLAYEDGKTFVLTKIYDSTGVFVESKVEVLSMTNMQTMGSGITYARRYSLASLLGIVTEDDDGNGSVEQPKGASTFGESATGGTTIDAKRFVTLAQQGKIAALYKEKGLDRDAMRLVIKSKFGAESHKGLTTEQASEYIKYLMDLPKKEVTEDLDGNPPFMK